MKFFESVRENWVPLTLEKFQRIGYQCRDWVRGTGIWWNFSILVVSFTIGCNSIWFKNFDYAQP